MWLILFCNYYYLMNKNSIYLIWQRWKYQGWKMAQWLRTDVARPKHRSSIPSIHVGLLTTTCKKAGYSFGPWQHPHVSAHRHTDIHTQKLNIKLNAGEGEQIVKVQVLAQGHIASTQLSCVLLHSWKHPGTNQPCCVGKYRERSPVHSLHSQDAEDLAFC